MATQRMTYRQRLFVLFYLGEANGNATEAARMAGYSFPDRAAAKLVVKGCIRAAVAAKLNEAGLSANEVLARLADHATSSIDDFIKISSSNTFSLDLQKAKKLGRLHCIKKLKEGPNGIEFELYDAQAALEKLGKYHALWTEKLAIQVGTKPLNESEEDAIAQVYRSLPEHGEGGA